MGIFKIFWAAGLVLPKIPVPELLAWGRQGMGQPAKNGPPSPKRENREPAPGNRKTGLRVALKQGTGQRKSPTVVPWDF